MAKIFQLCLPLSLGRKVRIIRTAYGLSQQELGSLTNTTQAQVSALERNLFVYPKAKYRILTRLILLKKINRSITQ